MQRVTYPLFRSFLGRLKSNVIGEVEIVGPDPRLPPASTRTRTTATSNDIQAHPGAAGFPVRNLRRAGAASIAEEIERFPTLTILNLRKKARTLSSRAFQFQIRRRFTLPYDNRIEPSATESLTVDFGMRTINSTVQDLTPKTNGTPPGLECQARGSLLKRADMFFF